jgi:hypothetical protein
MIVCPVDLSRRANSDEDRTATLVHLFTRKIDREELRLSLLAG